MNTLLHKRPSHIDQTLTGKVLCTIYMKERHNYLSIARKLIRRCKSKILSIELVDLIVLAFGIGETVVAKLVDGCWTRFQTKKLTFSRLLALVLVIDCMILEPRFRFTILALLTIHKMNVKAKRIFHSYDFATTWCIQLLNGGSARNLRSFLQLSPLLDFVSRPSKSCWLARGSISQPIAKRFISITGVEFLVSSVFYEGHSKISEKVDNFVDLSMSIDDKGSCFDTDAMIRRWERHDPSSSEPNV